MQYNFPIAPHSYFSIRNKKASRTAFFSDDIEEPQFLYGKLMNEAIVKKRISDLPDHSIARTKLELVLASIYLQGEPSTYRLEQFRKYNEALYGVPRKDYTQYIIQSLQKKVTDASREYWKYIEIHCGDFLHEPLELESPSRSLFLKLKSYFEQYSKGALEKTDESLAEMIKDALYTSGLSSRGWRVDFMQGHGHAQTIHELKTIFVGDAFVPRTKSSKRQIVAHEVFGHALSGHRGSVEESEGIATLLEQLTADRFTMRRSFRYLSVALGWGVTGKAMKFSEVYEIVWRCMVVSGRYAVDQAKYHAYDECARAFRGGRPDVPGAVFLKDSLYFSGNIAVWNYFMSHEVSYEQFVKIIEGRERVLL